MRQICFLCWILVTQTFFRVSLKEIRNGSTLTHVSFYTPEQNDHELKKFPSRNKSRHDRSVSDDIFSLYTKAKQTLSFTKEA